MTGFNGNKTNLKDWVEVVNHILEKTNKETDIKFKDWLLTKEGLKYCLDPITYRYIYNIKNELENDNDHLSVIVGMEGSGKSRLALNYCAVTSPTFSMVHVCYKPEHLYNAIRISKPGDTILIDEGGLFLFSRDAMGSDTKSIVKLFTIVRQKNIHFVICIPNFWILDSVIRDHRVKTLINVFERGSFEAFKGLAIKIISKTGAKFKTISRDATKKIRSNQRWYGHWTKEVPNINDVTEEKYLKFKKEVMDEFIDELEEKESEKNKPKESKYIKTREVAERMGCDAATIKNKIEDGTIIGKKLGGRWYIDRESWKNSKFY